MIAIEVAAIVVAGITTLALVLPAVSVLSEWIEKVLREALDV